MRNFLKILLTASCVVSVVNGNDNVTECSLHLIKPNMGTDANPHVPVTPNPETPEKEKANTTDIERSANDILVPATPASQRPLYPSQLKFIGSKLEFSDGKNPLNLDFTKQDFTPTLLISEYNPVSNISSKKEDNLHNEFQNTSWLPLEEDDNLQQEDVDKNSTVARLEKCLTNSNSWDEYNLTKQLLRLCNEIGSVYEDYKKLKTPMYFKKLRCTPIISHLADSVAGEFFRFKFPYSNKRSLTLANIVKLVLLRNVLGQKIIKYKADSKKNVKAINEYSLDNFKQDDINQLRSRIESIIRKCIINFHDLPNQANKDRNPIQYIASYQSFVEKLKNPSDGTYVSSSISNLSWGIKINENDNTAPATFGEMITEVFKDQENNAVKPADEIAIKKDLWLKFADASDEFFAISHNFVRSLSNFTSELGKMSQDLIKEYIRNNPTNKSFSSDSERVRLFKFDGRLKDIQRFFANNRVTSEIGSKTANQKLLGKKHKDCIKKSTKRKKNMKEVAFPNGKKKKFEDISYGQENHMTSSKDSNIVINLGKSSTN